MKTADEDKRQLRLQIAHVLFMDVVGYSKLLLKQQSELLRELNEVVTGTKEFREAESAGKLIRLPTGDGMALVFRTDPEAPAECAMEIARALKSHPALQLRMGIHSGPVNEVADVNQRANIAGAGINMAQRVMDCGDAGHILLSKHVAEDLEQDERWRPLLHDLGICEVKHGVRVGITNLYSDEIGNPQLPKKFQTLQKQRSRVRWAGAAIALLLLAAVVAAFVFVLHRPTRSALSVAEKSIAVLPFENLSSDKENAFFTDGVQDEILTHLARIADLKVISRTSVMQYKSGIARNLREIGQQLGVAHVLEGSVQRAADRVRVNAQLVDARTDAHLWAQTYDRDLADVFAIQSEIAKAIADQLRAKLSPDEKAAISQPPTTDLSANILYLQAKALEFKAPEQESLLQAVDLLEEAVERDPNFILAYCMLGRFQLTLYWGGYDHTPARRELANRAIQSAVRLQPDVGEVHLAQALYAYQGFRDYDRARVELDLARRTLPNNADIYFVTALIDRRQGRWPEVNRNLERAIELDPLNFGTLLDSAHIYNRSRRYGDAMRLTERAVAIKPHHYFARIERGFVPFFERADIKPLREELSAILTEEPAAAEKIADVLFLCAMAERDSAAVNRALAAIPPEGISAGNFTLPREWFAGIAAQTFMDSASARTFFVAARATVEKFTRDQPDYAEAWRLLGRIDAALGRKEDAVREGRHACELLPLSKDAWAGAGMIESLAVIYALTGEKDLAFEQLAVSTRIPNGVTYGELKLAPEWDPIRGDPRFEALMQKITGPK